MLSRLSTKTILMLSCAFWTWLAMYHENLAATYVSLAAHWLTFLVHAIEVKINRLLDDRGITVYPDEIAR